MLQAPKDLEIKYSLPSFAYQPSAYQQNPGNTPFTLLKQNMSGVSGPEDTTSVLQKVWYAASLASSGACAYHGYKRNGTIISAILWTLAGGFFPVISVAIAAAQGFGKEKAK